MASDKHRYKVPKYIKDAAINFDKTADLDVKAAQRADKLEDMSLVLEELRLSDLRWRVKSRGRVTWTAYTLLFIQNIVVFSLIAYPIIKSVDMPTGYYQLMTIVIAATLSESAYVIRQIVRWLFKEIDYYRTPKKK